MPSDTLSYGWVFLAGALTFLSPCVLPLIPSYISYITGASMDELQSGRRIKRATALHSLLFIFGFSLIFILLGASATAVGQILLQRLESFKRAAGVLIILLGVHLTGWVKLPFLNYAKHLTVKRRPLTWLGAYGVGAAFGFGWTPCIGPILASILAVASTQETIGQGMLLLAAYSAGLGIPFLLAAAAVGTFLRTFARAKQYLHGLEIASGLVLIAVGILMVTDRLTMLVRYFTFLNRFAL